MGAGGPAGTLHPKASQKPNSGEVVVGSSPPPPSVSGIVGRALAKDNYVDGWMAIAGWDLNAMTAEEVEKTEALEHLVPLATGTVVLVQNQRGPNEMKRDNSGMVGECLPHLQYKVKLDGTG